MPFSSVRVESCGPRADKGEVVKLLGVKDTVNPLTTTEQGPG